MRYLVIGGAGFIGSNLVRRLVGNDHKVVVVDNYHSSNPDSIVDGVEAVIEKSCEDMLGHLPLQGFDGVFYTSGPSSSPMYKEDHSLVGTALNGFIRALDIACKEKCRLVYASSSSVYNGNPVPWRENMDVLVTDYYTEVRYGMERLATLYSALYDSSSIGLRLFSVYGPGERPKGKYANLVSQFLWAALEGKPAVVYGDGSQRRDFTYVDDVVDAFLLAMESPMPSGVYNVGTGVNHSLEEMIKVLEEVLGTKITREYVPNTIKNYVANTLANTSLSRVQLTFVARYSLEEGIRELISVGGG